MKRLNQWRVKILVIFSLRASNFDVCDWSYLVNVLILGHCDLSELLPQWHRLAFMLLQLSKEVSGSLLQTVIMLSFLVHLNINLQEKYMNYVQNTVMVMLCDGGKACLSLDHATLNFSTQKKWIIVCGNFMRLKKLQTLWVESVHGSFTSNKCCKGFFFSFSWHPNCPNPAPSKPEIQEIKLFQP